MDNIFRELPCVLFSLNGNMYGISCRHVISMNKMSEITPMPSSNPEVLGVMKIRERVISIIDVKKIFNFLTSKEEETKFFEIMDLRLNDHKNWINELIASVKENREFKLTTDPHQCAFGKWYDSYSLSNKNVQFLSVFSRFDKPHKEIHMLGEQVIDMVKDNKQEEAIQLIEKVQNTTFKQMIDLFDEIKKAYSESRNEIIILLGKDSRQPIAITVDNVEAIEYITDLDETILDGMFSSSDYLLGIAKRKNGSTVTLVNDEILLDNYARALV